MNRRQLATLLVVIVVVGGIGLVVYNTRQKAWSPDGPAAGQKLLGDLPINDVEQISIRTEHSQVNLIRMDNLWRVSERGDYPADFPRISNFLILARNLKAVQTEEVGPSQWARLQLAPPGQGTNSAMTVEFKGANGQPIRTLLLGKMHLSRRDASQFEGEGGWPDGRYVRVGTNSQQVVLLADPLEDVVVDPDQWLNKDFVQVGKAKSVEVIFPESTNSWKLTRESESADWTLADAGPEEKLDSSKVAALSNPLSAPTFSDVAPGSTLDGTGTNAPTVIRIATFDSFDYTFKVGQQTNDEYRVTAAVDGGIPEQRVAEAEETAEEKENLDKAFAENRQELEKKLRREQAYANWTYQVPAWTIDPLLQKRSDLLAAAPSEPQAGGSITNDAAEPAE